jgi:hypothetical protein
MTVFTRPPSTPNNKLKPFKGTLKTGEKIRNINGKSFVVPADIKKPDGSPTINASNTFQASNIPVGSAELREKIKVFGLDAQLETIELAESKVAQIINDETKTVDAAVANADEKDKNGSAPVGPGTPSPRRDSETPNLIQNPLEKFSTVSSLWTMAVLTPMQYNDPSSYRTGDLGFAGQDFEGGGITVKSGIVFSAAGRGDKYRTKIQGGKSPEYFVDNFKMTTVMSATKNTGNTNAINFEFDIFEPYSMGLLLESLQVSALKAGYPNYLDAPFVLRLDFVGFSADGTEEKVINKEGLNPKYFVMKLKRVTFDTNESGTNYKVQAFPYNHSAYLDTVNMLFNDISVTAPEKGTVEEMLKTGPKSLEKVLNDNEKLLIESGAYSIPDVYIIDFPEKSTDFVTGARATASEESPNPFATVDADNPPPGGFKAFGKNASPAQTTLSSFESNHIGKSTFGFDSTSGGNFNWESSAMYRAGDSKYNEETGRIDRYKMQLDPKQREFFFTQKQPLTDVITQTILSSRYAKDAISGTPDNHNLTPEGYIKWFKIDVQVAFLDYDPQIGDFAKQYTFRIVPYFVHHSIFKAPGEGVDTAALQKTIAKRYDYIYSGQNVDVLKFDIKINNLFFAGSRPTPEANTSSESNKNINGTGTNTTLTTNTPEGTAEAKAPNLGKKKLKRDVSILHESQKGGSGFKDVEQLVAENFQKAFIDNSAGDLITIDLDILGDTYWMVESGQGNHIDGAAPRSQTTDGGEANYTGGEIYIFISFRTPVDTNTDTGLYEFANENPSPFSGIYKVLRCESEFKGGQFTQKLRCIRMSGQPIDYGGKIPDGSKEGFQTEIGSAQKEKTEVGETPPPVKVDRTITIEEVEKAGEQFANNVLAKFGLNLDSIEKFAAKLPKGDGEFKSKPKKPVLKEYRKQANGSLVNFNIDRTKPFTESKDRDGNTIRVYDPKILDGVKT